MTTEKQSSEFFHFELLNGHVLQGILKASQPGVSPSDHLALDTSGRSLAMHKTKLTYEETKALMKEEERKVFLPNAFFFLDHADAILSDSRMFLAPVPVQSGVAYTGISGFRNPTLGVYIEWWQTCPEARVTDESGKETLVYHLAGSPLTGSNRCAMTDREGNFIPVTFHRFMPLWQSFMEVNTRYTEAKERCEHYSLQQVADLLRANEQEEAPQ